MCRVYSTWVISVFGLAFLQDVSVICKEQTQTIDAGGISSIDWGEKGARLETDYLDMSDFLHASTRYSRKKRFVMLTTSQPNRAFQECLTPGGHRGHCRHLHYCVMPDFKDNFLRFMDYMCIIERSYVGVCCPDDVSNRIATGPRGLGGDLPAGGLEPGETMESVASDNTVEEEEGDDTKAISPQNRGCGVSMKSHPRITGGRPADPGEWPWMAALLRPSSPNSFCGGVLITDRHILTAAHCTYRMKPKDITVRLGEYDFRRADETRARDFRVVEIRQHVDFEYSNYENDIAIVKVHRPATFNSYIWPVCLPPVGESWENKTAVVTGWGTTYFGGPTSDILMEVGLPVWPQHSCTSAFTQRVQGTVLCAGAYGGGRDSCQGDSGGPLLHALPNGRWVTIGIVSWGIRCGEPGHPGVYTRVNAYLRWIVENALF